MSCKLICNSVTPKQAASLLMVVLTHPRKRVVVMLRHTQGPVQLSIAISYFVPRTLKNGGTKIYEAVFYFYLPVFITSILECFSSSVPYLFSLTRVFLLYDMGLKRELTLRNSELLLR